MQNSRKFSREMGYVLRVRLASFFTGAAAASAIGLYALHNDYKIAQQSISQQVFPLLPLITSGFSLKLLCFQYLAIYFFISWLGKLGKSILGFLNFEWDCNLIILICGKPLLLVYIFGVNRINCLFIW